LSRAGSDNQVAFIDMVIAKNGLLDGGGGCSHGDDDDADGSAMHADLARSAAERSAAASSVGAAVTYTDGWTVEVDAQLVLLVADGGLGDWASKAALLSGSGAVSAAATAAANTAALATAAAAAAAVAPPTLAPEIAAAAAQIRTTVGTNDGGGHGHTHHVHNGTPCDGHGYSHGPTGVVDIANGSGDGLRGSDSDGGDTARNPEETARNPEETARNPEETAPNPEETAPNPEGTPLKFTAKEVEMRWLLLAPSVKVEMEDRDKERACGHSCGTCPTKPTCQLHDAVGLDMEDFGSIVGTKVV
jgi:hypothetical protein